MTAPDDSAKETILAALRAYHGGTVYLMGAPGLVCAGFASYHDNEVSSIEWDRNLVCLHVRIGPAGRVVVNVRMKEDRLSFSCTCSRMNKESGCEHAVCVVLTLKNLLMPDVFKPKNPKPALRRSLLAGLTGVSQDKKKKAAVAGYSLVLEHKEDGDPDVHVALGGERLTKLAEILGSPLIEFAASDLDFLQKIDALIRLLKRKGNKYPIVIRTEGEDREVAFDGAICCEAFTELSLGGKEVFIIKRLRDADKRSLQFILFGDLAYFPEAARLAVVENTKGWETWEAFEREMKASGFPDDATYSRRCVSLSVPLALFETLQPACLTERGAKERDAVLFTMNGKKTRPAPVALEPRMTVLLPDDGSAVLRAECAYNFIIRAVDFRRFRFFEDLTVLLYRGVHAGKNRDALMRAFFELMDAKTDARADMIIKTALDKSDIVKRDLRSSIRKLLLRDRLAHRTGEEDVFVQDGEWRSARHDREREALLFKVLFEALGWEIFNSVKIAEGMRVPAALLYDRLPLLCERFSNHGIELFLKGKPVRQARWEFKIDAGRKTELDWFELRPEIRCDGELLDEVALEGLFAGRGIVEKKDCIRITDSNSRQVLERIAAAFRASEGPGRRKHEPVRVPRLRILDWAALRSSGVSVGLPREDEEIVERLLNFGKIEAKPLPGDLRATLRPYQREGYFWLAFLYEHRLGACLADDMGLGKTVQAICLLGGINEGCVQAPTGATAFPHLIVVPPSLVFNWEQEVQKFYPRLKIHIYTGSERSDDFDKADLVVTTYGTVRRDIEKLKERQFNVIIFDEAQAVKNIHADTTGAARRLRGLFKLTMTGTPVENHLGEYYSVLDLAVPGLLGEYDRFRPLSKSADPADLDIVIARTRPFVLRRTKEAVLTDLPAKMETDIYLDLTEEQKTLYHKTLEQVRSTIDEAYRTKVQARARIIALTAILKLRQICITPQLIDPSLSGVSPKTDFLIDQLRELIEENHCALVFSQFTSFLDILGDALKKSGIAYLRLDGSTPMAKRKALVSKFQSGEGPLVFLLSLKAGGQGLNLTKASYVFHLDPWWNPAVESQASDRAHRIGQLNKVTITRLLMRHTIEEKMMELKKRKRALYDSILGGGEMKANGAAITRGDFDFLLDSP